MPGKLFVTATPIGNLSDISERAKETLASVNAVLCEDTRVTSKLLAHLKIKKTLIAYHQHSDLKRTNEIIERLRSGEQLALVTDAGTPAISDPGGKLIEVIIKQLDENIEIIPIPGPSAVTTALSIAGVPADKFVFMGYPPNKKGRKTYFEQLQKIDLTIVLYESTHRIIKTLEEMTNHVKNRQMVVCRELTKLHETIYRGTIEQVTEKLKSGSIKGEFVIVVGPPVP